MIIIIWFDSQISLIGPLGTPFQDSTCASCVILSFSEHSYYLILQNVPSLFCFFLAQFSNKLFFQGVLVLLVENSIYKLTHGTRYTSWYLNRKYTHTSTHLFTFKKVFLCEISRGHTNFSNSSLI